MLDICTVMEINGSDVYHASSNNIWSCGVVNIIEFGRDDFGLFERSREVFERSTRGRERCTRDGFISRTYAS